MYHDIILVETSRSQHFNLHWESWPSSSAPVSGRSCEFCNCLALRRTEILGGAMPTWGWTHEICTPRYLWGYFFLKCCDQNKPQMNIAALALSFFLSVEFSWYDSVCCKELGLQELNATWSTWIYLVAATFAAYTCILKQGSVPSDPRAW